MAYCYKDGVSFRSRGFQAVCNQCGWQQECGNEYKRNPKKIDVEQRNLIKEWSCPIPEEPKKREYYADFSQAGKVIFRDSRTHQEITMVDEDKLD